MLWHPCAPTLVLSQYVSYSRSAAALETIAVAHVAYTDLLSFCSYIGISCGRRHQEEGNTLGDVAFVGSRTVVFLHLQELEVRNSL